MRDLTEEELLLVSGGTFLGSQGDGDEQWWSEAFGTLENGLRDLSNVSPSWLGGLLEAFADFVRDLNPFADELNARTHDYADYVREQQSNGQSFQDFDEWYESQNESQSENP